MPTLNDFSDSIVQRLAAQFGDRSPLDFAARAAAGVYGTAGEWDLPDDVEPRRELLYLAVGIPDAESLPRAELAACMNRALERPGDGAFRYGFGGGYPPLREWLAEDRAREGVAVDADWYQLTNGSAGAIDLVVRALIDPGDVIIAERPTYMGTLHNFRGVQAEIHLVPVDRHGLDTELLEAKLRELAAARKRVKLIYTISTFQNPTGFTLSADRRRRLLELAAEHDVLILDDEAYRDLYYDRPPPPALSAMADGYGVITTGTFSKTVATGLRIGWIHARPEMLKLFSRMRFAMGQNQLALRMMSEFVNAGYYAPHLERVRALYKAKCRVIDSALREQAGEWLDWQPPEGGFYLWATAAPGLDARDIWRTAVQEGVAVNPGDGFGSTGAQLRIAYPWTPMADLEEAARRLGEACRRVADGDVA